ncbi:unnamed protein product, partial [Toxocara canis]|uniref:Transmembrane protein n=1 Tax=Toxocara canis TaxID=6265 RepID=A0A183U697_TOXCA
MPSSCETAVVLVNSRYSDGGGLSDAKVWPCRTCGILLGICHLVLGITLLLFDIFTNSLSETAFAITAALAFIVCALFAFIAA